MEIETRKYFFILGAFSLSNPPASCATENFLNPVIPEVCQILNFASVSYHTCNTLTPVSYCALLRTNPIKT